MAVDTAPELPHARLEARAGTALGLRLRLRNRMMAAGLLRPVIDDWVANDGQILATGARADPAYVYLLQGAEARQTITLLVPAHVAPDTMLRSSIGFPGMGDQRIAVEVRVLAAAEPGIPQAPVDVSLDVALPLGGEGVSAADEFGSIAQASYSLVAGLAGLDMIPARWLVAELLTAVCEAGEAHARTPEGQALLDRLGRTRFFKNGVVAFASAQAPRWILSGLSASSGLHAALGGQIGQGQLLYIWERWLLGLADADIESNETTAAQVRVPDSTLQMYASDLGTSADRWFGTLVLGLARLSPRIAAALEVIAERAPAAPDDSSAAGGSSPPQDVMGEDGPLSR